MLTAIGGTILGLGVAAGSFIIVPTGLLLAGLVGIGRGYSRRSS